MSESNELLNKKAVALKYDSNMSAPIVVASGMGYIAEKMMEVATDANIPVYEDTSLATMLSRLSLGQEIPEELYRAIVEIYVFFLKFKPDNNSLLELEDKKEDGDSDQ